MVHICTNPDLNTVGFLSNWNGIRSRDVKKVLKQDLIAIVQSPGVIYKQGVVVTPISLHSIAGVAS